MLSGFFKGNMLPENVKTLTDPRPAFAISIFFQSARLLTSKNSYNAHFKSIHVGVSLSFIDFNETLCEFYQL